MLNFEVQRLAAFAEGGQGGNPAGVVITDVLPDATVMLRVAAEVGYSETAFAAPMDHAWRVRYFAPLVEVPFCGHATIALGAALAQRHGNGLFQLRLNDQQISVEGRIGAGEASATLRSGPTSSAAAGGESAAAVLDLFALTSDDLDSRIPLAIANAGASHFVLALRSRDGLRAMRYDFETGRRLMTDLGLTTISLIQAESPTLFHARNPFAIGGVYEDPATGAAAAALGGYLRALGWPHDGRVEIIQGEDMGMRSRILVEIPPEPGAGVAVSGSVRPI